MEMICRYFGEDIDTTDPEVAKLYCDGMCDVSAAVPAHLSGHVAERLGLHRSASIQKGRRSEKPNSLPESL